MDGGMNDRADIKILILFILDELSYPLNETALSEIISESGYVGRYDFKECLSEMADRNLVARQKLGGEETYMISPIGHNVACDLQGSLMDSIRERSRTVALRRLSLLKRGAEAFCTAEQGEDGGYHVRCRIHERGIDTMDVTVVVPTASEAAQIKEQFLSRPEESMRGLLALLTGKVSYFM